MAENGVFLGIDTSNYTTSLSLFDTEGRIIANLKMLLPVKEGEKGLRQSDALFHHTVQLPQLFEKLKEKLNSAKILAVGVSSRPRDAEGSYMPCFLAGRSAAVAIADTVGCPLYEFSHQCGHIAAALYSAGRTDLFFDEFAAFHVSGGTTDLVLVKPSEKTVFNIEKIGGTLDLNAGQLIDRTGVMMGLRFPAGPLIESLARNYTGEADKVRVSVKDLFCNLSGGENKVRELYRKNGDKERCAAYAVSYITQSLKVISENLRVKFGDIPVIYAGGVMSCSIIKKELSLYGDFASPEFSSDNAAGIAYLTGKKYLGEKWI